MKLQKLFNIDSTLIENLNKEKNMSKLINELLSDYFNSGENSTKQEILDKINLKEKEINESKQMVMTWKEKIEAIEKKGKLLKKIFRDIPDEILDDFKVFSKMTEVILRNRFNNIYSVKYEDLEWKKVLKAYGQYFKKNVKDTKKQN